MKKFNVFALVLLIIGQTIFGPMGVVSAEGLSAGEGSSVLIEEGELTGVSENKSIEESDLITLTYKWELSEQGSKEAVISVPKQLTVTNPTGELTTQGQKVGTYSVTNHTLFIEADETELTKGNGIISFEAKLTEEAYGEFSFGGQTYMVQEAVALEEVQEEITEELKAEEVQEEITEELKAEEVQEEITEELKAEEVQEEITEELKAEEVQEEITEELKVEEVHEEITEEAKVEKEISKSSAALLNQKHGFNLNLSKLTDLDDKPYDDDKPLGPKDQFKLEMKWDLEDGHNYLNGDTVKFQLPQGIKITKDIPVTLQDDFGLTVASAVIKTDGTVELTFTEYVETHSNVKGHLAIIAQLDEKNVEIEDGSVVLKPIGDEDEIKIPINLGERKKTIEKKGTPNKGYNADEINWEVTINKLKNDLENASVTDILPAGTEYKAGSLKVTKLKVDLYGNILGPLEEVEVTGETVEGSTLNIPLGDIKDAYKIEYITTVTDDEQKSFKNNATLVDSKLDDVSANTTVTIKRGEPIKKSAATGYDPKTGIINWAIEFNYNQKDLTNVTLKDAWEPKGAMHLIVDSLKFQEVTIDENGKAHILGEPINLPAGALFDNSIADQFEVTGISTDKAYKVTYQTKVTDRVLEGFKVTNTAGFGGETSGSGTGVGTYYGSKSAGNINYEKKTIDWTIQMNHDEYPMEKISVKDTLGAGLTLDKESIVITVDGNKYKGTYTVSDGNPFTLKFPDEFSTDKKIVIKYKTNFVADEVPDNLATNKANLTWTPEGGNTSITKEIKAQTPLNEATKDNSWKNGSYNPDEKEITWTIYTNYRENQINNLIVKDEPQGNQVILPETVKVYPLVIKENGGITEESPLNPSGATVDAAGKLLEVTIGKTNKAYKIEYKTSIANLSDIQKEYVNQAKVLDGGKTLSEIEAKVGIANAHTYGAKSGKQDGKQIHWAVTVNPGQQKVANLKLLDTVSVNQDILIDTLKVYEASVDNKGIATKKGEPISADRYVLNHIEGEPTFTVEWNDTVERAYIVEYSTLFFEKHGQNVTNNYEVTGDSIVTGGVTNGDGSVKIEQLGSGGGSGEAGYLIIDKIDSTNGQDESKLNGAKFDLIDADTGKVLKSGTTGENGIDGQIDFGRLLFGKYKLVETEVPDGFVTPNKEQEIVINKAYKKGDDKESFEYVVENYVPVFAIQLSKTGEGKTPLLGAEFTLYDVDNKELQTKTTDKEGLILFEDLKEAGMYYVKETKAPAGYVLNEKRYDVTIGEKERVPVKVSAENKARGAVQLTKIDKDTKAALKDVKFALQKENATGGYETIETFITDAKGQIKTSNTLEAGNYQFVETEGLAGYRTNGKPVKFTVNVNSTNTQKLTMTNEQHKGSIKLIKKDAATKDLLQDAEFKLVDSQGKVVPGKERLSTDKVGEIVIGDLFLGKYQLIETKAPAGYKLDETPIDLEVTEDEQVVERIMFNHQITNISVDKKWNNGNGETKPVTVKLLPTDKTVELNDSNNWKGTFEGLRVHDDSGEEIDYTVVELKVDGYESVVSGDKSDGYIITNTELTSISGSKEWKDDNNPNRPESITVQLFANGEKLKDHSTDVTGVTDWRYEFNNLPKYDSVGNVITYTIDEVKVDGYETKITNYDLTNLRVGKVDVKGEKTWKDVDPTDRPTSITVNLSREVAGTADVNFTDSKLVEPNKQGKWLYEFSELDKFDENGAAYTYIVKEENVPANYESKVDGYNITNVRIGETEVSGTKRWKDDKVTDRPGTIAVNLLRNNVVIDSKNVTKDTNWKYSFSALDKYDEEGQLYNYEVKEQFVPGYSSKVNGEDITNTRSEKTSIEVTKGWLDNDSEDRPDSIIVYLYQNEELFDTVNIESKKDWVYEFTDLEAFDEDGQPYNYTVQEKALAGYETTIDGFNLTNLRVGKTEILGTKIWKDQDDSARPESITVNLLRNGEIVRVEEVKPDKSGNWTYNFTDLDEFDENGIPWGYTVDEVDVEGYAKSAGEGNDLINTRVGKTEVSGTKIWKDQDDSARPESITVNLLRNGEIVRVEEVKPDEAGDWTYSFTDLDEFDENGIPWGYTVDEVDVEGYAKSAGEGNDLINTRVGKTEVSGAKIWKDQDDSARPESITVNLLRNGEIVRVEEVKPDEAGDWTYSFTDLDEFDENGIPWGYTVDEVDVEGYAKSAGEGNDLINTRVGKTEVSGTKIWKDQDDSARPDSITVNLLRNGEIVRVEEVKPDKSGNWTYNFTDLDEFDENGIPWGYTVDEVDVEGYAKSAGEGNDLINTRVGKTEISGTKIWKDQDDSARPESITVNLLRNGEIVRVEEVKPDEAGDWTYSFTDLDEFDENGIPWGYTVDEVDVEGYAKSAGEGNDLINTRVGKTEISGTKIWKDQDDPNRPDSIKVDLLKNGEVIETQTVTSEDQWNFSFLNLDEYDSEGLANTYTVKEQTVVGYDATVDGYNITNELILGVVELTKVSKDEPAKKLEGAVFEIQDAEGKVVKSELITDKDGKIVVELKPGNYQFVETKAPTGYKLDKTPSKFTIEFSQVEKVQVIMGNTKLPSEGGSTPPPVNPVEPIIPADPTDPVDPVEPEKPVSDNVAGQENDQNKLPQTGEELFMYMIALGVLFLIAGGVVLLRQRRTV